MDCHGFLQHVLTILHCQPGPGIPSAELVSIETRMIPGTLSQVLGA